MEGVQTTSSYLPQIDPRNMIARKVVIFCFAPCNMDNTYIFGKHEDSATKYAKTSRFYRVVLRYERWNLGEHQLKLQSRTLTALLRELARQACPYYATT